MVFDDCVFLPDNVFMVKAFEYIDLFFDGADVLFADGYFFHGDEYAIIKVDTFVNFAVCSFSDFFYELV